MNSPKARLIAYYLPQFHPIPENDEWWGKGFTEWTNVAKAKPLFPGHYQPHIPADLGFYDLRVPETRIAQAEMAREYGIEGFCYWHYWFAGKRLLERPFNEVLKSGEPRFPFCLAWANQSWTGIWHGNPGRILVEQTYPGIEDYKAHFYALLDAFADDRYIKVDGKPMFQVFCPELLPDPRRFTDCWRELAVREGLAGLYFIGDDWGTEWLPEPNGFDASLTNMLLPALWQFDVTVLSRLKRVRRGIRRKGLSQICREAFFKPAVYPYSDAVTQKAIRSLRGDMAQYPIVMPNWDNTPRSGDRGRVLHNSTPDIFKIHLEDAIRMVSAREPDGRIVFIKSWNEWAEGNHLEPDLKFGRAYLDAIHTVLGTLH